MEELTYLNRRSTGLMVALFAAIIVIAGFNPAQSVLTSGAWRLISPTEYIQSYPDANLHSVYMLNGGTSGKGSGNGYAVGDHGLVFQWDGFSWNQAVSLASGCQLNSVNFGGPLNPLTSITSSAGWIVGGNNAGGGACGQGESLFFNGVNWVEYPVPGPGTSELKSVFLVQGGSTGAYIQAYAAGTEDGTNGAFWVWNGVPGSGGAWSECSTAGCGATVAAIVNSVYMTHCTGSPCAADDGIAVANTGGPTNIYRFVGGVWTARASPLPAVNLNSVAMSSPTNGWAVGDSCTIIHTTDGDTWTGAVSPGTCTANLRSIVMLSSSEAWAVGDADASGYPTVVHGTSLDSSPTWTRIPVNQVAVAGLTSTVGLNSVTFAPSGGNVWSVGASGIAAFCLNNCNSPSGAIWSTTTSPQTDTLNSVYMYSDSDGFAVGNADAANNPTIIRWNGGTYSWTRAPYVAPLVTPTSLYDVYMSSGSSGWAVGGTGSVASALYYDGNTWTGKPVPTCGAGCYLYGVYMQSDSNAWAVGTGGVIMHSTSSAGAPFVISPSTVATDLRAVTFDPTSGGQSGWAVGGDGVSAPVIVHTSNGGADAWPLVANPAVAGVTLTSVFFQDSTHGWATGTGAGTTTLLYWNGVSWTLVPVTINGPFTGPLDLERVWVLGGPPAQEGWAVGKDLGTGYPVTVHYDGSSWETMAPSVPTAGSLLGLTLRSGTNGLAVGTNLGGSTVALIYHLDPPGGVTATNTGATTYTPTTSSTSITTSSTSTSSTTSSLTSTSSSQTSTSTSQTSTSTTSQAASSTSSSVATSVSTVTVTASSSSQTTPLVVPAVPGFPWESIVAGVIIGLSVLTLLRQRRRRSAAS
jgi:hypothetical protein